MPDSRKLRVIFPQALSVSPKDAVTASCYDGDGGSYGLAAGDEAALAEFSRVWELANEAELVRQAEDAEPAIRRATGTSPTEDRLARALDRITAGTYTPQGPAAYGLASPAYGTVTGEQTCGVADDLGYCMERFHAPGCGSLADPEAAGALRPVMERTAHRPYMDESGQVWYDQQFGSAMSLVDHVEASTGIRLGDVSPFETGRARREVAQVQRPQVFGDPDDPDGMPLGIPASTARTAAALAAQGGIQTTAGHREQQAAWRREHDRQAARYRPPGTPTTPSTRPRTARGSSWRTSGTSRGTARCRSSRRVRDDAGRAVSGHPAGTGDRGPVRHPTGRHPGRGP